MNRDFRHYTVEQYDAESAEWIVVDRHSTRRQAVMAGQSVKARGALVRVERVDRPMPSSWGPQGGR